MSVTRIRRLHPAGWPWRLVAASTALFVAACGGGGGDGNAAPEGGVEIQYVAAGYDADPLFRTGYYAGNETAGQIRLGAGPAIGVTRQPDGSYAADATAQTTYKTKTRLDGAMTEICEIAGFNGKFYGDDQDRTVYVVVTTALQPLGADDLRELDGRVFEGTHGCDPGTRVQPGPPYAGQVERTRLVFDNRGGFVSSTNGGSPGGLDGVYDADLIRALLTTAKSPQLEVSGLFAARLRPYRIPGAPARYVIVESVYSPTNPAYEERPFIRIWEEQVPAPTP